MQRLDVAKVLFGAFALPWTQRHDFTRVLALPVALLFTLTLAWFEFADALPEALNWFLMLVYGVFFTLLAVPCHRLILIGLEKTDKPLPGWEGRETRFLIWMGMVWLIGGVVFIVGSAAIGIVGGIAVSIAFGSDAINSAMRWITWFGGYIPAYYLLARLSLMLPAIATDRQIRLSDAWSLGKNNGLKLMLVVSVLPWALSSFLELAWRDNSSAFEVGLLTLLGCLTFIIEISALSLAYRELSRAG